MPHFLAIAWMYREEYAQAGFVMLRPRDVTGRITAIESAAFTVALTGAAFAPYFLHLSSVIYLAGAFLLNAMMLVCAIRLLLNRTRKSARALFFASIIYLPILLALLVFTKA
jgi:protoheme IX farnesyltransferase